MDPLSNRSLLPFVSSLIMGIKYLLGSLRANNEGERAEQFSILQWSYARKKKMLSQGSNSWIFIRRVPTGMLWAALPF
jgi:hypothetical protein